MSHMLTSRRWSSPAVMVQRESLLVKPEAKSSSYHSTGYDGTMSVSQSKILENLRKCLLYNHQLNL